MSISEAAGLTLQAAAIGKGGETILLDMGEQVPIVILAETMISLSGFQPYSDIDIVFVGLRSGEKVSELLHTDSEHFESTGFEKLLTLS